MKDRECINCKKFLTCKGKPTPEPCVNYEERKKDRENGRS